ncbi:hypothetical protein [Cryptosporangium sp. NPDC051539]|uniref:hypothetical protein n=1 Tax=Cryptosporangium sp. NPDC051539 TaxID=3363962 RepID=UPI00378C7F2D
MPLVRRLLSPAGLLLALLCFGLPFVTVSCESPMGSVSTNVSGAAVVVDARPDVEGTGIFVGAGSGSDVDPSSPDVSTTNRVKGGLARLFVAGSVVLTLVAFGLSWVPRSRWWPAGAAVACVGAIGLLAIGVSALRAALIGVLGESLSSLGESYARAAARDMVHVRFGPWVVAALLAAAATALAAEAVRRRPLPRAAAPPPGGPPPAGFSRG